MHATSGFIHTKLILALNKDRMCQNRPFIFVEVCESLEVYMYESTTLLERTIAVC